MKINKSIFGLLALGVFAAIVFYMTGSSEVGVSLCTVLPAVIAAGKSSNELKQERAELVTKLEAVKQRCISENNREYTPEEFKEVRQLQENIDKYNERIEFELGEEKRKAKEAGMIITGADNAKPENREMRNFSIGKLAKELVERGKATGLEKELLDESAKEAADLGVVTRNMYLSDRVLNAVFERNMSNDKFRQEFQKRTQNATGTANLGGNLIPTEKWGFFDALYARTVLAQLGVTNYTGLAANVDLTGWDTTPVAYWAAENGTQSPTDATFANRSLRPNLLGAAVDISMLLKIQTNDSVDRNMLASMMRVMAVAYEAAVINGDGTNKPLGILGTSGIQDVAIGTNGGAPTLAKIQELITKVGQANADMNNAKFLTNWKVRSKLKQTVIDSGSGAMILPYGNYFGGNGSGTDLPLDGFETLVTSNVPSDLTKGTAEDVCSALIFGDFSQVVTAQFGGLELSIDDVSAAMRRSGKYALTMNMYVDSAVKQPAALGAILDITTT